MSHIKLVLTRSCSCPHAHMLCWGRKEGGGVRGQEISILLYQKQIPKTKTQKSVRTDGEKGNKEMKWKRRYIKKKRELAVLRTDCKEGLGEWWNTWKQTMSDKMGLSRRNLLHCDGVYLPAASSLCPCGLVQRVVRHVHYVSCYLFVPSAAVTICMCHISDTLHMITAPV